MTVFERGPDGGVIEHDGKRQRKHYGEPRLKPKPEAVSRMRRETLPIKIAGAVMRRVNRLLRGAGVKGLVVNASFEEDGYHLHATLLVNDQTKVAMFAEMPEGQYKVWP